MKELPMFTYNLWMACLQPDTKSIILSSYQHCDEQQFQTLSCAFYTIFSSIKARFSHTSIAVTRLYSCSGKIIRVCLACILFSYRNQYFSTFLGQNIQQKVLVFHSVLLGACPRPCSKQGWGQVQYLYLVLVLKYIFISTCCT